MMLGKRILFDLFILASLFFIPWWVVVLLGVLGVFYFPAYYELVVFGFVLDILYGSSGGTGYGVVGFLVALVCFFAFEKIRREIRA